MSFSIRDHLDPSHGDAHRHDPALPAEVEADGVIPDDLVDRMLDGEVDADRAREVMGLIRKDREASKRFDATTRILQDLKRSDRELECPDFSSRVLAEVSSRSGLFSPTGFRRMLGYRYAAAAMVVLAIGAIFVAQRVAPDAVHLSPRPSPVSHLVRSVPTETAGMFSGVRSALSSLTGRAATSAPSPLAVRRLQESGDEGCGGVRSRFNIPLTEVLWSNECHRASVAVCKGRKCPSACAQDSWAAIRNPHNAILIEDDLRRSNAESDVVFVTYGR